MPSPPEETPPLTTLLSKLAASGVEFVLVGGLAAVAQGAPLTTFDVDVVHRRTSENLERLLEFLRSVGARYRGRSGPPLPPSPESLAGPGHSLFATDLGPLDVLGSIEGNLDHDALLPETVTVELAGRPVRVLSLAAILRLKRASTHPKDRLAVPILEETLARTQR